MKLGRSVAIVGFVFFGLIGSLAACGSDSADDGIADDSGSTEPLDGSIARDGGTAGEGGPPDATTTKDAASDSAPDHDGPLVDADVDDASDAGGDADILDAAVESGDDAGDAGSCTKTNGGVEQCDDIDNDCNGRIDDGLSLYQECASGAACVSGRTTCAGSGQSTCSGGFVCNSASLCVARCTAGAGRCQGIGLKACPSNPAYPETCSAVANPDQARDESCNDVDDDCDGTIDETTSGPGQCFDSSGIGPTHTCDGRHDPMARVQAHACECDPLNLAAAGCPSGYACGKVRDGNGSELPGNFCVGGDPIFQTCTTDASCGIVPVIAGECATTVGGHGKACACIAERSTEACPDGFSCGIVPGETEKLCYRQDTGPQSCSMNYECTGTTKPDRCLSLGSPFWVATYEASRPTATAISAGTDPTDVTQRRACNAGRRIPWTSVSESDANDACARILDITNQPMRLCAEFEWQNACVGKSWLAHNQWSEFTTPAVWNALCNADVTDGSGAMTFTGAMTSCSPDWSGTQGNTSATQVFDLSGNAAEWTSTSVVSGATTSYRRRGGAFDSTRGHATCEDSTDLGAAGTTDEKVGFRCCANNAPALN